MPSPSRTWLLICPQSWVGTSGVLFWVCWCWRLYTMPTSWEMQWRWVKSFLTELLVFQLMLLYIVLMSPRPACIICVCKVTPLLLLFTYCSLFWANPAHSISPLLFYKCVLIRNSTCIHVYLNSCTVYNSAKRFGGNFLLFPMCSLQHTDLLQGAGTEEACLIDILASRSNEEINAINDTYKKGNGVISSGLPTSW